MSVKSFLSSIKGRLISLVLFFLVVLLGFSLVMRQRNSQVEQDVQQLLEVRMSIRRATENISAAVARTLSDSRKSIIKRAPLANDKEQEIIRTELKVLDSLKVHLRDTNEVLLQTLDTKLDNFSQNFKKADSTWNQHLADKRNMQVRLYAVDPSIKTYRVATEQEKGYHLASDTLAEILIEAEDAFYVGAFLNYSHAGFQGRGYVDYTNPSDDFIEWKFSVPWSGKHLFVFHYGNGSNSDRPLSISVDSIEVDTAWAFPPGKEYQWTVWGDTKPLEAYLTAGTHTLRATAVGESGANLDYLKIMSPAPYATTSLMHRTLSEEGIVDEAAVVGLAKTIVKESKEADMMNGLEDALRIASEGLHTSLAAIIQRNEKLMHQDIAQLQWQLQKTNLFNFFALAIVALLAALATHVVIRSLKKSIKHPVQLIQELSRGKTNLSVHYTGNELDAVIQAGEQLSEQLKSASKFAIEVGDGNLQYAFVPSGEEDVLGNALVQMRDKLQAVAEEDHKRNWQAEGFAKFSALLRKDYADQYDLAVCLISAVVNYVNANQGGLFVYNSQDQAPGHLELIGCYAYERRKYLKKQVMPGEGLLGQVFLEGETTCLTEVPDNYLSIRSGLGGANPKSLLLVPLNTDDKTEGVLELASFREFACYEIELIEKVAVIVAAHLAGMRLNEQTKTLLKETTLQAEQLREQEEELRQNMEEMQATQEQLRRDALVEE